MVPGQEDCVEAFLNFDTFDNTRIKEDRSGAGSKVECGGRGPSLEMRFVGRLVFMEQLYGKDVAASFPEGLCLWNSLQVENGLGGFQRVVFVVLEHE